MKNTLTRMLALALFALSLSSVSYGANNPELSDRTYRTVNKVQKYIANEAYQDAKAELESALDRSGNKKYDQAVLLQQLGYIYSIEDNYAKATEYFAQALKIDALPVAVAQQVRYSLAQLYMVQEKFANTIALMKQWFQIQLSKGEEKPDAMSYMTLASAYVQQEQFKQAIPEIKQAIALSDKPSESWYMMLMSAYYQTNDLANTANVLTTLTELFPEKKQYWKQLSGIEMERGKDGKALAALESAYKLGLLDEEKEILRLTDFLAYQSIPFRAATTLAKEIEKGTVEKTSEHLDKLGQYWHQAKELTKAITSYRAAYALDADPKTKLKIARLMIQDQQYKNIIDFASDKQGVPFDVAAELEYLKGMAYFELENNAAALKAMQQAAKSNELKPMASPWIAFLTNS
ncbi:tetratricopeptide repeat protein [Salinivibrio costicola]|uniref:Tetratricopeptide repeat protein n=1 Tax=Salinivibrio costicola TaxID=51367 RepID=A0ABX6K0B4_SALCS|nr:tetratricopeptide repeat protein [Salinivibrio costicola]QIR05021.1 tetratricopeptide repeat protein [Salinivibrio costicola]